MNSCKKTVWKNSNVPPARAVSMAWNLFILVAIVLWPAQGFAADTFGTLICNFHNNVGNGYPYILNVMAYVMGVFFALRSALLFKAHADNPAQVKLSPAIAHAGAAAALTALPAFATVVINTFLNGGGGAAAGGNAACAAGSVAAAGTSLDVIMANMIRNIHGPIFMLISIVAFCVGGTYIVQALLRASKTGADPRSADPKLIITNLLFGAVLMAIATVLPSVLKTIFGAGDISQMSTATNIIQWSKITGGTGDTAAADKAIAAVLAFIQIIGGIAFLRGWMVLKKAVEGGQATVPQGLTHIIAGAMCINMDKMLAIMDETFGTGIIS